LVLISIILILGTSAFAQKYAVLHKVGTTKEIRFKSGDEIRFKLKVDDHYRREHIVSISDTALHFHYFSVSFIEIDKIDVRDRRFSSFNWKTVGTALQIAGIGYIALDSFNKTVVQGDSFEFEESVWVTGAILAAAGTLIKVAKPKRVKLGPKYKMRYFEMPY
jgi:hypothetical protein